MSIAFFFWGLTEGFLHETVTCCALYILRPVMLIWALPHLKYLHDNIKTWIRSFKITSEFAVFTVIVYSVLFTYGWRKSAHDTSIEPRVGSGLYFGDVVLSCLLLSAVEFIRLSSQERPRGAFFSRIQTLVLLNGIFLLSSSQLSQLIFSFGLPSLEFVMMPFVQALLLLCVPVLPFLQSKFICLCQRWITLFWIIIITLLDIGLVIYIHLTILEREKEYMGWICVIVFLEVLRMIAVYEFSMTDELENSGVQRQQQTETSQQGSHALHLCHEIMYMFGAVGLVLLNSVTLTAELILKARNGERIVKDLRVLVFPSECVFALYCLVLQMHAFWKIDTTESTHDQRNSDQAESPQLMKSETHEMENLSEPDSAFSQTP
ncbi:uncharacterized protein LOC125279860 isoform X1 [Megalobrama amblycephala]|uniref:uncharacterized protein LOC125279860 isoform X1 n=1 Tax=Megalobrama amblycephala TaxID=75352 RepID=UPI002013E16E|nr:uncharacterized protein LOC125279860 isoform X1 [Megalobrama amblycephala]